MSFVSDLFDFGSEETTGYTPPFVYPISSVLPPSDPVGQQPTAALPQQAAPLPPTLPVEPQPVEIKKKKKARPKDQTIYTRKGKNVLLGELEDPIINAPTLI